MMDQSTEPTDVHFEMFRLFKCMGLTQTAVAKQFGITQQAVSKIVINVREYLKFAKREEVSTLRGDLTERWETLYLESMRAWTRSQEPEVVTTHKSGQEDSETVRETPQVGSPGFLRMAGTALSGITDLWEADMLAASRQGEIRSVGKSQVQLIDDQMKRLQVMKQKLGAAEGGGDGDRA